MNIYRIAVKPRYYGPQNPKGTPHDYDPIWDYEEETRPKRKMMRIFEQAAQDILSNHMSNFEDLFTRFRIAFVKDIGGLARFASGTSQEPVILIDLKQCVAIQRELKNDFTMYQVAITTLMHELKHAMQEAEGREDEMESEELENDAESFGMRFI